MANTALSDAQFRLMNRLHRIILKATFGLVLRKPFGMPAVQLQTVGRTSGQIRRNMLTAPVVDGQTVVLVASRGGDTRDPDWYKNLVANPEIELTMAGTTRAMRARTASAAEKAELWPRIVTAYKGYAEYQRKTDRDIPVVICEPR